MTLCGPLAVCKGREVSGQTTVAMQKTNTGTNSELSVYIKNSNTLAMDAQYFANEEMNYAPKARTASGFGQDVILLIILFSSV